MNGIGEKSAKKLFSFTKKLEVFMSHSTPNLLTPFRKDSCAKKKEVILKYLEEREALLLFLLLPLSFLLPFSSLPFLFPPLTQMDKLPHLKIKIK